MKVAELEHKNQISPYDGREMRGVVKQTILRGNTELTRDSKVGTELFHA